MSRPSAVLQNSSQTLSMRPRSAITCLFLGDPGRGFKPSHFPSPADARLQSLDPPLWTRRHQDRTNSRLTVTHRNLLIRTEREQRDQQKTIVYRPRPVSDADCYPACVLYHWITHSPSCQPASSDVIFVWFMKMNFTRNKPKSAGLHVINSISHLLSQ